MENIVFNIRFRLSQVFCPRLLNILLPLSLSENVWQYAAAAAAAAAA